MHFRSDINGLRAVAVLSVLLYHFGISGFSGGFAGVDVFFVISGFLMAGIIFKKLEKGAFSLKEFYAARAKRIVPALLVLCIVLLGVGWFWLPSTDFAPLGKHAASALTFLSNFIFMREDGYFDTFSQDKLLLHTWSLSVEWQFYLLFPLLMMFLFKRGMKQIVLILAALTLISFAASVIVSPLKSAFAFYMLPTRAWEMLAGALVFILGRNLNLGWKHASLLHMLGLGLIVVSVVTFTTDLAWPGLAAAVPVMGAVFVILARHQQGFSLLSNKPVQTIGLWSYSIYLWHWPIFVALRYANVETSVLWCITGILASILLGALSYLLIEEPVRKLNFPARNKRITALYIAPCVAVAVFAFIIHKANGLPQRTPDAVVAIESVIAEAKALTLARCGEKGSIVQGYPNCDKPAFVVYGDSHARATFIGVAEAAAGRHGLLLSRGACPPVMGGYLDSKRKKAACNQLLEKTFETVQQLPVDVPLVVIARFSFYINGYNEEPNKIVSLNYLDIPEADVAADREGTYSRKLEQTLCRFREKGRKVFVLRPIPEIGIDVPRTMARQAMFTGSADDIFLSREAYEQRHRLVQSALDNAAQTCGVTLLDPVPYLCTHNQCAGSANGMPYYHDDDHLSVTGAKKLTQLFEHIFKPE